MENENTLRMMSRLTAIREMKAELSREEVELSTPLLHDVCQVGNVYDLYTNIIGKRLKKRGTSSERKQFVFIILFLYSPSSLAGFKMRRGLREKIAEVLDCTCSNVSHDYKDIGFLYRTYKKFRNDVDNVLAEIRSHLGV